MQNENLLKTRKLFSYLFILFMLMTYSIPFNADAIEATNESCYGVISTSLLEIGNKPEELLDSQKDYFQADTTGVPVKIIDTKEIKGNELYYVQSSNQIEINYWVKSDNVFRYSEGMESDLSASGYIKSSGYQITDELNGKAIRLSDEYLGEKIKIKKQAIYNGILYYGITLRDGSEVLDLWISEEAVLRDDTYYTDDVNLYGYIYRSSYEIRSKPEGVTASSIIDVTADHLGEEVKVLKECQTNIGKSYYVTSLDDIELGWINEDAILIDSKVRGEEVDFKAKIIENGHSIGSQPYGSSDYYEVSKSDRYVDEVVNVSYKMETARGIYYFLKDDDFNNLGWISELAIDKVDDYFMSFMLSKAKIKVSNFPMYKTPTPNEEERENEISSKKYAGLNVFIVEKASTANGDLFHVVTPDKKVDYWVEENALERIEEQGYIYHTDYVMLSPFYNELNKIDNEKLSLYLALLSISSYQRQSFVGWDNFDSIEKNGSKGIENYLLNYYLTVSYKGYSENDLKDNLAKGDRSIVGIKGLGKEKNIEYVIVERTDNDEYIVNRLLEDEQLMLSREDINEMLDVFFIIEMEGA